MYKSLREDFQEDHKMHAPSQEHEQISVYVLGLSMHQARNMSRYLYIC